MSIFEIIMETYPELETSDFGPSGTISLQNDGDGDFIAKWNYSKPVPEQLAEFIR
jgi:hypothetical protein